MKVMRDKYDGCTVLVTEVYLTGDGVTGICIDPGKSGCKIGEHRPSKDTACGFIGKFEDVEGDFNLTIKAPEKFYRYGSIFRRTDCFANGYHILAYVGGPVLINLNDGHWHTDPVFPIGTLL